MGAAAAQTFRDAQAEASPGLYTEVEASEIRAFEPVQPLIDADQATDQWRLVKARLVSKKAQLGVCSLRKFVKELLGEDGLPRGTAGFDMIRRLLQIMLVLPASSAQSERDFSAQVCPSPAPVPAEQISERQRAEQDQGEGAGEPLHAAARPPHVRVHQRPRRPLPPGRRAGLQDRARGGAGHPQERGAGADAAVEAADPRRPGRGLWALCHLSAEALALATASDMPLAAQERGPAATAADLAAQINPTVTHARQEAAEWVAALGGSDPMAVDEEAAGGNAAA